ncbi:AMP-binding protein, partial [Corynebacterium bovis]|uniref:AMP-binding protein n=1 Tax=Corynebacterium bovis TaxID=36808 RepID=UPI0002192A5B
RWSAAEAARAVDALAAHLLDRGAGPGVTVGVALPRGVEQVCSVLAVWRAGGAVMPLEVDGNGELTPRSGEILARSGATLLLDRNTVTNVLVEGVAGGRAASTPGPRRRRHLDPGDPAYVIHTSGTTGDPKGVTVPWRVLDGLLRHQVAQGVPAPGDVLAHLAPDQFDVAVQEVATAALGGHRLVVVDDATRRDTAALARVLDDEGVDVVFATTTLLDALAAHHARTGAPVLRTLVQAGERLDPGAHLRAWCTAPDGPVLRNDYGPTETPRVPVHGRRPGRAPRGRAGARRGGVAARHGGGPRPGPRARRGRGDGGAVHRRRRRGRVRRRPG